MTGEFVRGYRDDAGLDIVLKDLLILKPGFQTVILPARYNPGKGEVAFLISRGSTAARGIFPIPVAIDHGYTGLITAWVVNTSNHTHKFLPGERVFSIVNLKLGEDQVKFEILKEGQRGSKKLASSGK